MGDGVLFVERANEFEHLLSSKGLHPGGKGKPSVNSAFLEGVRDPKPSELAMARVKVAERRPEARTREPFNTLG